MPRPTLRGVIFALVGVAIVTLAYLIERPELLAVGVVAVAAPLIALVVVATGRPRVRVSRHLDPVVATVGEPVTVTVTVAGRSRAAEWVERVPMRPGFAGPGRLPDVRRTRPARFSYRYWPAERGLVAVGPLLIEERDPVALAVREMGMTPIEALAAATRGGAAALRRDDVGHLGVGARGDLVVLDAPDHRWIGYRVGVPVVGETVIGGKTVAA